MIQPSSFLNNYTEEAFKDFRTRVLLDSGFFESEEGSKQNFAYNLPTLTTNLDSDTQEFLKATGIKDHSIISHINNYVVKLKRFGLWSKIKALYPFVSDQRNVLHNTDTFSGWNPETGTITGNFTDPLGGATAYKYTTVGTAGLWTGSPTMFISSSTKVTYSFWIKSVSGNNMTAVLTDAYNVTPSYTINITGTWTYITATLTLTPGNVGMYINNLSDPTNGFLIWRPQMEVGSVATTYQPTTSPSTIYTNHFKYNLKDPRDLDAAFRLTFSGGWQFSQLGATPNGTNAYADTKLSPTTSLSTTSTHMSFYSRTNKNESSYELAADGHYSMILYQNSFYVNFDTSGGYPANFALTDTRGYYIGSRLNNTNVNGFRNGVKVINNIGLPSNLATGNIRIANGLGPYYSSKECSLVSIGDGLTDSETTNLYYLTEELQANLNRNVSPYNSFRGILDEYPGAAAAYSLRRLSGSYGGPLVKVRRSSDNTEQDIFPTASGSLDTTSLLSFVGAGNGFVTTWYDQSGNGVNTTQSNASKQPQIVASGSTINLSGKPSLYWGSITDKSLNGTITTSTSITVSSVFSTVNYSYYTKLFSIGDDLQTTGYAFATFAQNTEPYWNQNGSIFYGKGWSNASGAYISSTNPIFTSGEDVQNLLFSTLGSSDSSLIVNGSQITSFKSLNQVNTDVRTDTLYIGNHSGGVQQLRGKLQELILYTNNQYSNRNKFNSQINTYYNIYWDGSRKGLLDFYPNAAAAYSVRALSSSYRGPLLRVRRASDNTERDIFALQNGNLDTFTLATFCSGTDGFVTTWYDQSGLGKNATQTTAGEQPQIVSSGSLITTNGKPAVQFDGSNDNLLYNSNLFLGASQRTILSVYKPNNATGTFTYSIFGQSFNNSTGGYTVLQSRTEIVTGDPYFAGFAADLGDGLTTPNTLQKLAQFNYNGTTGYLYKNNSLITSANITLNAKSTGLIYIGLASFTGALQEHANANIQECIAWTSNQDANTTGISTNINIYYGIY